MNEGNVIKALQPKMFNLKFMHKCRKQQRNLQNNKETANLTAQSFKKYSQADNNRSSKPLGDHVSPGIRHSSFIPTTTIKVEPQKVHKERLIAVVPIDTPAFTHSKFPFRRPKSIRQPRNLIPYMKKKYSTSSSQLSSTTNGVQLLPVSKKIRASSRISLNGQEDLNNFRRYSTKQHLKTQYIERKGKPQGGSYHQS